MRLCGAHDWNRTNDLLLTKEVLYRLSYVSTSNAFYSSLYGRIANRSSSTHFSKTAPGRAVNGAGDGNRTRASSLEGYSSTIELLPPGLLPKSRCCFVKLPSAVSPTEGLFQKPGGGRWIRTTEGMSQQIYSLPPLAAWVSLHGAAYFQAPKAPLSRAVLLDQAECPPVQARCAASR